MSAELLRRAASEMRVRAEAATRSPWQSMGHDDKEGGCDILGGGVPGSAQEHGLAYTTAFTNIRCYSDAAHIVSWHPAVALAVADLLDEEAQGEENSLFDASHLAIAVARAYLGGDPDA